MTPLAFPPQPYNLPAPQVDPGASLSIGVAKLHMPTLDEIRQTAAPLLHTHPFAPTQLALEDDIAELKELAQMRKATLVACHDKNRERADLSWFLNRRVKGVGIDQQHRVGGPEIETGEDLARWFENDTPLLAGWMALNSLFKESPKPPTLQAEIWAALNLSIHTALLAAWHYKWMEPQTRMKPRPSEVDASLSVLYAKAESGAFSGVPRHPSYPSGHSTVGGATSAVLKHYFCEVPWAAKELDKLADNAGLARMWAGIHYRADHTFGVALGEAVAQLVIQPSARP